MTELSTIDKVLAILKGTNDGDLLSPSQLKLTELAVNGNLNQKGLEAIDDLYNQVISGQYTKPYLHGINYMTHDHDGYVFYKNIQVEHYSLWWVFSQDAKNSLERLQQYCLYLESKGIEPTSAKAMFISFDKDFVEYKKQELDAIVSSDHAIQFTEVSITRGVLGDAYKDVSFLLSGTPDEAAVRNSADYKDFILGYKKHEDEHNPHKIDAHTFIYGTGETRPATADEMSLLLCCSDYLKESKLLEETASYTFRSHEVEAENNEDFEYDCPDMEDEYDEEI